MKPVSTALRVSLIEDGDIAPELGLYAGEPSIHNRRPVPAEALYPMILINPPTAAGDDDGLTSDRPWEIRDLCIYGRQPDDYRLVERLADLMRLKFHRQKFSIAPEGYSVIDIRAAGPLPAPVDDAAIVGRMVTLTIRLRRQS